jgi:pantoate--beta-alanine ligase
MSSRNKYLTPEERLIAPKIYESIQHAISMIEAGETDSERIIYDISARIIEYDEFDIDYVQIVDTDHLQPVDRIEGEVLIAVAAYLGKARLIDNAIV